MAMGLYGLGHQASMAEMGGRQAYGGTQSNIDFNTQVQNASLERQVSAQDMNMATGLVGAGLSAGGSLVGWAMGR